MNKQEYMHLHGLYREIFDDVDSNREDTECGDLKDAMPDDLPRPVDVSASKDEHRRALFGISGHLGENVEGIKETDFEYDESPRQPDLVSGDIALYRQPGGKRPCTGNQEARGTIQSWSIMTVRKASKLTWLRRESTLRNTRPCVI
jgi:hypothetical protein